VAQTITSMSAGSTFRLHASQTLKLLPCISSHMVLGNPVNSLNHAAICAISNRTFYKQWILQYPQRFDFVLHWNGCPAWVFENGYTFSSYTKMSDLVPYIGKCSFSKSCET